MERNFFIGKRLIFKKLEKKLLTKVEPRHANALKNRGDKKGYKPIGYLSPPIIAMKFFPTLLLLAFPIFATPVFGQVDFRAAYKKADPVPPDAAFTFEKKVKIHQGFLEKARQANDPEKQAFGHVFLFYDHLNAHDFVEASRHILEAEAIAQASGNASWQGRIAYLKGILSYRLSNYADAVREYSAAAALCGQAGDSLCVAESLEQMASMYCRVPDFEKANRYFDLALPLIEKFGGDDQFSTTLNNRGTFFSEQKRPAEAIPYYKRAIAMNQKIGKSREKAQAQAMNNLADAYRQLHRLDSAIVMYERCVQINTTNGFAENLIANFGGMYLLYAEKGNFHAAFEFSNKYHDLTDSLTGIRMQEKIADLEFKYKTQQQELELQKSQKALLAAGQTLERRTVFLLTTLFLAGFWVWFSRTKTRRANRELEQNQENLHNLTRILLEKNTQLTALEAQTLEPPPKNMDLPEPLNFEHDFYNQRILTRSDWAAFKAYFEKASPGFLQRLRTDFPAMTDAEERLFLLIKLNLTRDEAAAIQGISDETIKKTRQRLRKRLVLEKNELLDAFVKNF